MAPKSERVLEGYVTAKSADAPPMDSCTFGLLNRNLRKHLRRTLNRFGEKTQEKWDKIDTTALGKVYFSWKI